MSGSDAALQRRPEAGRTDDGGAADAATDAIGKSVLLEFLPHALRTFRQEPALAITLCYLLVAMAGIFYNYSFFRRFDIPILTLSQISDFLVAGMQQPIALLLVLSTFPLCWIADRLNFLRRRRRARAREALLASMPDNPLRRFRLMLLASPARWLTACAYVGLVVIYGWMFVNLYAKQRAAAVRAGEAQQVSIWLGGAADPLAASSGRANWTYLGAVSNYVFVYDNEADHALVVPVNAVQRIEPVPRKRAGSTVTVAPIP